MSVHRAAWAVGLALSLSSLHAPARTLRVEGVGDAQMKALAPILGHVDWHPERRLLRTESTPELRAALRRLRLHWQVEADTSFELRAAQAKSIGGYACYRTVEETATWAAQVVAQHPQLARVVDIGDSWQKAAGSGGYDLQVLRLTADNGLADKPVMLVVSGLHAREYAPVEVLSRFAQRLVTGYGHDPDVTWMLDHQQFHFLLQANPDGRKRAESQSGGSGSNAQRKNMDSGYCASGRLGVDLNRNFAFVWGQYGGSSGMACEDTFRGPSAASEPETQAISNYARTLFPDRRGPALTDAAPVDTAGLFLDLHSYSRLVLWPWGMLDQPAPNGPALETLGRRFAWFNGHTPQQAIDLYATDGTSDGLGYGELGVASYAFELGTQFFQNCASFERDVAVGNLAALEYGARVLRAPYQWAAGPTASAVRVVPDLALPGESVQFTGVLDDRGFNQGNGGTQPVQAIASARVYSTALPWVSGAAFTAAQAADGSFDAPVESVQINLFAPVESGRQQIYLRGADAGGALGPPAAAFLTVAPRSSLAFLSGRVSSRVDGAAIAGATVRAGDWSSATLSDGLYQRRLPAGLHDLEVSAPGFETLSSTGFLAVGDSAPQQDFALYALCTVAAQDAESGLAGWTTQVLSGAMTWGTQTVAGGNRVWTESPLGSYGNNLDTALVSPVMNLADAEQLELGFSSRCDTESGWDFGIVEMRRDAASPWLEIYRCSGDPVVRQIALGLDSFAGATAAQLRFRFTSDNISTQDGWQVDDIVLRGASATCRATQNLADPLFRDGYE